MLYTKLIIVEGCDKVGKTTLVKEMVKRFGCEVIKKSNPKEDAYIDYMNTITKLNTDKSYIFDRFYFSELVYGPLMRGMNWLDKNKFDNIETCISKMHPIVIHAYNTEEFIHQKMKEDGENYIVDDDVKHILRLFDVVIPNTKFPVLKYKIGDSYNILDQIKIIK